MLYAYNSPFVKRLRLSADKRTCDDVHRHVCQTELTKTSHMSKIVRQQRDIFWPLIGASFM